MNSLMIVGADKLGSIPVKLNELGFQHVVHISGRKKNMVHKDIPEQIDLVVVLIDFVSHNMSKKLKEKAKDRSIPICYAKRSWVSIYQSLSHCNEVCDQCPL